MSGGYFYVIAAVAVSVKINAVVIASCVIVAFSTYFQKSQQKNATQKRLKGSIIRGVKAIAQWDKIRSL